MTTTPHEILLFPQRFQLATDFVAAVQAGTRRYGVLLSGPNGVGKSGVGLLAYLLCAARGLPVVYLSSAETWVQAAEDIGGGGGHEYFLLHFWRQNADIIAASPVLRDVFGAAMHDEKGAFTLHVMKALWLAATTHRLGFGFIVDEVQHVTAAVARGSSSSATPTERTAGTYFKINWHDWMNDNRIFARMSIASAHGERDYKLPSGDADRLRIVEPLTDAQRAALLSHPDSPAFIADVGIRDRVVFYSGNILRTLMDVSRDLPSEPAALKAEVTWRLRRGYDAMREDCRRWLASLSHQDRRDVANLSMHLMAGNLSWIDAKGLYDAGIVYRTSKSEIILPVSTAAFAAYRNTVIPEIVENAKPLSSYVDGRLREFALEQQALARLSTGTHRLASKHLDGTSAGSLDIGASSSGAFRSLEGVEAQEARSVLYYPEPLTFPCDGIIMPRVDDDTGAIIVVECSTTSPRDAARVAKVRRYLEPGGVVAALAARFPSRPVVLALVWDGELEQRTITAEKTLALSSGALALGPPAAAVVAGGDPHPADKPAGEPAGARAAAVRVIDRTGIVQLGVLL
jgi:hypothetical protein